MPVTVTKEMRTEIVVPMPSGHALNVTLWADTQDQDAEFIRKMVEYADGTADKLRQQNRELKELLIGWRARAYPGIEQRSVVERVYPEI